MQQRFLANAAHQLRTPLAGLQMHLELQLRREQVPEVRAELERLHKATVRTGHMTKQLLALAKAESTSDIERSPEPVDLYQCAESGSAALGAERDCTQDRSGIRAGARGRVRRPDVADRTVGQPDRQRAALHARRRRRYRALRRRGGIPYLGVEDTGPGIPESERSKVFERFHRVAGTKEEGSGLGLAIVKEIADRHGARTVVETPQSGRGTRVVVLFGATTAGESRE